MLRFEKSDSMATAVENRGKFRTFCESVKFTGGMGKTSESIFRATYDPITDILLKGSRSAVWEIIGPLAK